MGFQQNAPCQSSDNCTLTVYGRKTASLRRSFACARADRRRSRIQYADPPCREAASLDLELEVLNEAHLALVKAEELNPGLQGPIDGAVDRQRHLRVAPDASAQPLSHQLSACGTVADIPAPDC